MINEDNKKLYEKFQDEHIKDGGVAGLEYAITELIFDRIKQKDYKIYHGGGKDICGRSVMKFDVVCWVNLSHDVMFMVALDVDEGDSCDLYACNREGFVLKKIV